MMVIPFFRIWTSQQQFRQKYMQFQRPPPPIHPSPNPQKPVKETHEPSR